ncbi:glycosyl hydrolase family 28-related protein [Danxiaibacter flavus]|uniref:Glycosyl hydrolase family 28-related protein n=1 Tax=Danxiaibacter flavus TaxID=3049108 RepID=A0ABV3ZG10_9BACT|nr:glycosyl hydrolase family 28-related protein [Chitinophagaceae bacterium DXS]
MCYKKLLVVFIFTAAVCFVEIQTISGQTNSVSVTTFGAKGDGQTDDQPALQKALMYCVENNKTCVIPKTKSFYFVKKSIRVPLSSGNRLDISSEGAVIKSAYPLLPDSNKLANMTAFREDAILSIGPASIKNARTISNIFDNNLNITVNIKGLVIDGKAMPQKEVPDGFNEHINIGLQIAAETISISDCKFVNVFGDGFMALGPKNLIVSNCNFIDVGGRGKTPRLYKVDNDHFGDAINISAVKDRGKVEIADCKLSGLKLGQRRSRIGITFNFSEDPNVHYNISIKNCDIQNYAKCVHIEENAVSTTEISNCNLSDFNYAIANVRNKGAVCNIRDSRITIGQNNNEEAIGAAALGLNYSSNAAINVYGTTVNFDKCGLYQSIAQVQLFDNCIFNAFNSNIFFAVGPRVEFNKCTFNNFGGTNKSFFKEGNTPRYVTVKDCVFNGGGKVFSEKGVVLNFINSKSTISNTYLINNQ